MRMRNKQYETKNYTKIGIIRQLTLRLYSYRYLTLIRPADILVPNWSLSRPAAFDIKVINPLNLQFIQEVAQTCGHAAERGEEAKHSRNDEACALRRWSCIPLVVEVFGDGAMKISMYF